MKEFFKIRSKKANRARIQVITIAVSLMLVAAIAIGGTVAWLVDTTGSVTNTFTFGDINITLTETNVKAGEPDLDASEADQKQTYANLLPGATVNKKATVAVKEGSENCYLFVKVVEESDTSGYLDWEMATGWTLVDNETNVYYREVNKTDTIQEFDVFKEVTISNALTKEVIKTYNTTNPTITITAYAIQRENLGDAANATTAWALLNNQLSSPNP